MEATGLSRAGNGGTVLGHHQRLRSRELWRTDGTATGTGLLKDLNPDSSSFPIPLSFLAGQRFLKAIVAANYQLWRTDGTAGGTVGVKDIDPRGSAPLGSTLILAAAGPAGNRELEE